MSRSLLLLLSAIPLVSCGTQPDSPPEGEPLRCEGKPLVHSVPAADASPHLPSCSDACGNGLNPPTGGPHCAQTSACRVYEQAEPECEWIHNLEHGHAVLLYNCPSGCPEVVVELTNIWREAGFNRRILLTPWPGLRKKVAAVVWGWSWSGDELDRDAIACVLSHQDEEAPEAGLSCSP